MLHLKPEITSILLDKKSYWDKNLNEAARQGRGNEVRTASRRSMLDILPGLVPKPKKMEPCGAIWAKVAQENCRMEPM